MQHILVPVDGSEGACRAARFAAEMARALRAEVSLVHVFDAPTAAALGFMSGTPGALDDTQAKVAQASFERAKQAMDGFEVKEYLVEIGHPAQCILAAAKRLGVSQIIMGSRGLSPFKELLLGSVSERVVRAASCAVTIVR